GHARRAAGPAGPGRAAVPHHHRGPDHGRGGGGVLPGRHLPAPADLHPRRRARPGRRRPDALRRRRGPGRLPDPPQLGARRLAGWRRHSGPTRAGGGPGRCGRAARRGIVADMAGRSGRPGALLAAPGHSHHSPATATSPAVSASSPTALGSSATPRPRPSLTVIPMLAPPGRLHQTRARPSARSRAFRAEMTDLWAAIVAGRPELARPGFFPVTAYTQVKAIFGPAADWRTRLFGAFRLDVAA